MIAQTYIMATTHKLITWHAEQLAHIRDRLRAVALHSRLVFAVETDIAEVEQPRYQTEELLPRYRRDTAEIARDRVDRRPHFDAYRPYTASTYSSRTSLSPRRWAVSA